MPGRQECGADRTLPTPLPYTPDGGQTDVDQSVHSFFIRGDITRVQFGSPSDGPALESFPRFERWLLNARARVLSLWDDSDANLVGLFTH